jgi:hypothetical protein
VTGGVFEEIRAAAAAVMERARSVRIDESGLARLADELLRTPLLAGDSDSDPAHHRVGDTHTTLVFVLTLDAINFGSGWFPFLAKRPGRSGYGTVAAGWRRRFAEAGAFRASELAAIEARDCADLLGQDPSIAEVAELMGLFAEALRDLGRFVGERFGGRFEDLVGSAAGSAATLVETLAEMPLYRDVARYGDRTVPFYKRAQITASDLHAAFDGRGAGSFGDIGDLTIFADNLVPHVLRRRGVLVYSEELAGRIEAGELIAWGSPEEVEIRAGGLHAVERCLLRLRDGGATVTARQLDGVLWNLGQRPEMKAHPRHRTRSTFY